MGFEYSDYILETTLATKEARLRLHIKEVMDLLATPTNQTIDGMGYGREQLQNYLKDIKSDLDKISYSTGSNKQESVIFLRPNTGDF